LGKVRLNAGVQVICDLKLLGGLIKSGGFRRTIPEEEQVEIFNEVQSELHGLEVQRKKMKRKRVIVKPTKLA